MGALLLCQTAFLTTPLQTHSHINRHKVPRQTHYPPCFIIWALDLHFTYFFCPPRPLQDVLLMGEELVSEPYYCQLEAETCRLFTEHLGTLALVGESLHMGAAKRLRLVLFSDAYCSTLEYNIRVYCMDDTQDVFKVNCDKCSAAYYLFVWRSLSLRLHGPSGFTSPE